MKRRNFIGTGLVAGSAALLSTHAFGLEFYPRASVQKWAVVYGTRYGSTRDAAVWISEGMGGIAQVLDCRENPDLTQFDHLIFGSGIYGGKVAAELEKFVLTRQNATKDKIRACFVVCGQGERGAATYVSVLENLCGVKAPVSHSFPGRMTKILLSEQDHEGLKNFYERSNRPFLDYDNLSRKDSLAFGERVLNFASSLT